MPKRVLDGEALWTSDKLGQVEPVAFRAEYANLLPLALGNGAFEAEPKKVWLKVYGYNRPDVSTDMVAAIFSEFERVKMLFRWKAADGKVYGYWVGIDKSGRLPPPSHVKYEKRGPDVPADLLAQFLRAGYQGDTKAEAWVPQGNTLIGLGFGKELGIGSGVHSDTEFACGESELAIPLSSTEEEYPVN
jgi:hypothetical protein